MANIVYNPQIDSIPADKFGPVADGPALQLPENVSVKFI